MFIAERSTQSAHRPQAAFTLIEVLLVIGVISLLLGLLLPALGRARESGRGSVCAAMLHNAGVGMTLYLDDNEGSFWPYYQDIPGAQGGRRWWFGFERGGPAPGGNAKNRPLDKVAGFLGRYLAASAGDLLCPSFPYGMGKYFPKFSPPAGGYGYNTAALGGYDASDATSLRPRKIQEFVGRAAEVFALADGIHFDRLAFGGAVPLEQTFNEPPYIQWQDSAYFNSNIGVNGGFGHFRHNGRSVVLFLDAHADAQPARRPLHPFSGKGYGVVANLSDESLRTNAIVRGNRTMQVDLIYGLK